MTASENVRGTGRGGDKGYAMVAWPATAASANEGVEQTAVEFKCR